MNTPILFQEIIRLLNRRNVAEPQLFNKPVLKSPIGSLHPPFRLGGFSADHRNAEFSTGSRKLRQRNFPICTRISHSEYTMSVREKSLRNPKFIDVKLQAIHIII